MTILFLQKRILFPTDSGGKARTLNIVRYLARWHEMIYLCNLQQGEERYLDQMHALGVRLQTFRWRETPKNSPRFAIDLARNLFSPYPFNVDKDFDPALRLEAQETIDRRRIDLVICDFVQMARNAISLHGAPKVLFQHNVEAEIFDRHADRDPGFLRRRFMAYQAKKMRRFEGEAGRAFDGVIAVSQRDREQFERRYGWRHVEAIDTAVDLDFFQPDRVPELPGRVVFVGSMDWLPNQDGMEFFVRDVWPLVRQRLPHALFEIVGRNPPPSIRQMGEVPGVSVSGTVPDVRPLVGSASVVVVPLRIGGGTRIKIFEAMAQGKPIVSTTLGAEGLPVTSGRDIVIADEPRALSDAIVALLEDQAARRRIGDTARRLVEEHFSAERVARQFEAICLKVVERAGRTLESASTR